MKIKIQDSYIKNRNIPTSVIFLFALLSVLYLHGAVPFLMLPTLGQAIWTVGFAESLANNSSILDFYARNFGFPEPAAISFGLSGAWPTSLLIRIGFHGSDAYATMAALWLAVAFYSAYRISRHFGITELLSIFLAVVWLTMPIIWAHAGYSMVSLGIALLPFYFFAAIRLLLIETDSLRITPAAIAHYIIASIISVFMDGYTFVMFATGSSLLLLYVFWAQSTLRKKLLKTAVPIHVFSFGLAYFLYSLFIGKLSFDTHHLDFFRGWGLDLSFLAIPTKGLLWLPDLVGASVSRSDEKYFGDASAWLTTFALPIVILGFISWWRTRNRSTISTGILFLSVFGFYMALGPSLKVNSVKPVGSQSALMKSEYAIAPTGNAWISENLPGFNVMRASYRWSALGIFAMWLLIVLSFSKADRKDVTIWLGPLVVLFLLNLPDVEKKLNGGINLREMFQQIDMALVSELNENVKSSEIVAFVPWRNDFLVNYLASKSKFRALNIGGDKNLATARKMWPAPLSKSLNEHEFSENSYKNVFLLFANSDIDLIVLPNFNSFEHSHHWPPRQKYIDSIQIKNNELLSFFDNNICFNLKNLEWFSYIRPIQNDNCMEEVKNKAQQFKENETIIVSNWGPKKSIKGIVPNPQPGSRGGFWIQFANEPSLLGLQVYLDDILASKVHITRKSISAAFDADYFLQAGPRTLMIKSTITGKEYIVGEFFVAPEQ